MNTFFKFVDEVVLVPYLRSKGLDMLSMTQQSFRNQRTRAMAKWDALLTSMDLDDLKHNSRRWIIVERGEFRIAPEEDANTDNRILPYDSFALGFIDYAVIIDMVRAILPTMVQVKFTTNVTSDGHARLEFAAGESGNFISGLQSEALNNVLANLRNEFYLDPLGLDEYSAQFTGQVTNDLALWMGDAVDILTSAKAIASGMREGLIRAMRERRGTSKMEYKVPTHDTSAQFERFLSKVSAKFTGDLSEQVIKQMPVAEHGKLASRRWGIEVETGGARGVSTPDVWGRKYDGSLESAYSGYVERYIDPHDCPEFDHFSEITEAYIYAGRGYMLRGEEKTAVTNGCVNIDNPQYNTQDSCEYCGYVEDYDEDDYEDSDCAEFVSPILKSFHSRGLENLLEQLHGQPQNNTSGIHVHVESKDLTPKQVGAVVVSYQVIERLIESSYNRKTRSYCKERPASDVVAVMKSMKKATSTPAQGSYDREFYTGDRYHSVNLCSLSAHGTIEFRAMGPVAMQRQLDDGSNQIDYDHLIKWASFCREIVNAAKNGAPIKEWTSVKTFQDVINIFARYGKEVAAIRASELDQQLESVSEMMEV